MNNQLYNEYRVTQLPETGLQAGDKYHLLLEDGSFTTFIVDNALNLRPSTQPEAMYAPESDTDIFY